MAIRRRPGTEPKRVGSPEDKSGPSQVSAAGLVPPEVEPTLDDWVDHVEKHLYHRKGLAAFLRRRRDHLARRVAFAPTVVAAYQAHYEDLRDPADMIRILAGFLRKAVEDPELELQDFLEEFVNEDGMNPRFDPLTYRAQPPLAIQESAAVDAPVEKKKRRREIDPSSPSPTVSRPGQLD